MLRAPCRFRRHRRHQGATSAATNTICILKILGVVKVTCLWIQLLQLRSISAILCQQRHFAPRAFTSCLKHRRNQSWHYFWQVTQRRAPTSSRLVVLNATPSVKEKETRSVLTCTVCLDVTLVQSPVSHTPMPTRLRVLNGKKTLL